MDRAAASVFVVIEGEDAHQHIGARAVVGQRQIERVVIGKQLSLQAGAGPGNAQRPAALAGGAIDPQHMLEKNLGRAGEGFADQLAGAVAEKILADMGAHQAEAEVLEPRQRIDQRLPGGSGSPRAPAAHRSATPSPDAASIRAPSRRSARAWRDPLACRSNSGGKSRESDWRSRWDPARP